MLNGYFIADGVVHGYNWTRENWAVPQAEAVVHGTYEAHTNWYSGGDDERLSREEFTGDWSTDEIEEALFLESGADLVAYHGTPIYYLYKDGHSADEKGVRWKAANPDRVVYYGSANPFEGAKALDRLAFNRDNGADAVKVYSAFYDNGRTVRESLDDPGFGFPFIEKAYDLGYRVIATHKAIPFGPVAMNAFDMADIPSAAALYPEMTFEVLHAGFAFVEETCLLLQAFPNVYLNLEASNSLLLTQPYRFAKFLGDFLLSGAEDRIIIGSGCPLIHPRPTYEAIMAFEMPQSLREQYGYPEVTEAMKRKFLGENYLRLHGKNQADYEQTVAGDAWDLRQRGDGIGGEMWKHYRDARGEQVA